MAESNPFTKYARKGTDDKSTSNPFEKYKKPTVIQNSNRDDWAQLPVPHPGMFSDMDDEDAKIYYDAYAKHPDHQQDDEGNIIYAGKVVPKPEGNSPLVDMYTKIVGTALNPGSLGTEAVSWAADKARSAFGSEDKLKPKLPHFTNPAEMFAGGALNAARDTAELGGALVDYGMHKTGLSDVKDTPVLDAARQIPSYNPEGVFAHALEATGEIGLGMAAGDKLAASLKLAKVAPEAAAKFAQYVPKFVSALSSQATRIFAQSGGIAASVPTGSDKFVTGDKAVLPILQGLDTKTPDEAQNVIADRANMLIDAAVTAYPIEAVASGVKLGWNKYVKIRIVDPLRVLFSSKAREDAFAEEAMDILGQYTGKESIQQQDEIHKALVDLYSNHETHSVSKELGIQGIPDEKIPLDTATVASREWKGSGNPIDDDLVAGLEGLRNRTISEDGKRTQRVFEGVEGGLKRTLRQSEDLFGANNSVEKGREAVQGLAARESEAAKAEADLAGIESRDTANRIADNTADAMVSRRKTKNQKFKDIDPEDSVPADMKSFSQVYEDNKSYVSKELQSEIDSSNGSYGDLYKRIRPKLQAEISQARAQQNFDKADALREIKKNIEETQGEYLGSKRSNTGKFKTSDQETADRADEAMRYYKEEYTPYKQGPTDQISKLADQKKFKPDEFRKESRSVVDTTVSEKIKNPEHYDRLKKLLETEEAGKSSELLKKYESAKDKEEAFSEIQKEIYGGRFKDFFIRNKIPTSDGIDSFKKLLGDPNGGPTIEALLKENDPVIKDAMKSVWSDVMHSSGFKNQYTSLGTEKFTNSNQDLRSFMKYGRKIFSDTPKFMDFVEHMTDLSSDAATSRAFQKAGSGLTSSAEKEAGRAGRQVIAAQAGRLSKKATRENVIFDMILKARGVNTAMRRIADRAMSDPKEFERLLKNWKPSNKRQEGTGARDLVKFLIESDIVNDSDKNKFRDELRKLNTEEETDKFFEKHRQKSLLEKGADLESEGGSFIGRQMKKIFGE